MKLEEDLSKENLELHRVLAMIESKVETIVVKGRMGFPVRENAFLLAQEIYSLTQRATEGRQA